MKRYGIVLMIIILIVTAVSGCGGSRSSKADLQSDVNLYNTTWSQFGLENIINTMNSRNSQMLNGQLTKDSDDFKSVEKDLPKLADDGIDIIKGMTMKTKEGKALKTECIENFDFQKDLLALNLKALKSGNSSDKQKALNKNLEWEAVRQKRQDALKALNDALANAQ